MKIHKSDPSREHRVLAAVLTDPVVVGRVASRWDGELFGASWSNIVAGWAVEHYKKYGTPLNTGVRGYFEEWAESQTDEDAVALVEKFLIGLPDLPKDLNSERLVDEASELFNRNRARRLFERGMSFLEAGKTDRALSLIQEYSKVEMGMGSAVDLYTDEEAMKSTYAENTTEDMFSYPAGPMELFFRHTLHRGAFFCFTAPQKQGKSRWLVDMAYRAMRSRLRVAFFEIGDMEEWEIKDLFLVRAMIHPSMSTSEGSDHWPCTVSFPEELTREQGEDMATITKVREEEYDGPLRSEHNWADRLKRRMSKLLGTREPMLRLSCHPNLSISIQGIRDILQTWDREGFRADAVFLDYMDNLAPTDKKEEPRERVNTTWKLARALAMERHGLLASATQVNAAGFNKWLLDRTNFSEDNRKLSHITAMAGINVTAEEKRDGRCRLNWIVRRRWKSDHKWVIHVAGNHAVANPAMCACF